MFVEKNYNLLQQEDSSIFVNDQEVELIFKKDSNKNKNNNNNNNNNKQSQQQSRSIQNRQKKHQFKLMLSVVIFVILFTCYMIWALYFLEIIGQKSQPKHLAISEADSFSIQTLQRIVPSSPSQEPVIQQQQVPNKQQLEWQKQMIKAAAKDKYFLQVPVEQLLEHSNPGDSSHSQLKDLYGISIDQLELSLNLLYAVHNVNFAGQVVIQLAPYDKNKAQKQQWIKNILQMQIQNFQQKYNFQEYLSNQLPFCIVTPSYNNVQSKLFLRNLDSIFMQAYHNYHIVYIDDHSPDGTGDQVKKYLKDRQIPSNKIEVIINQKQVFALQNIYNAIHNHCNLGEVVMLLDGDDALIGKQVFGLYNAIYQRTESTLVYSNYISILFNAKGLIGDSSIRVAPQLLEHPENIRAQHIFFTSHLLSFYVDMFRKIKKQDLTYQNGTFFKYAYDVAICTPIIQMASDRVFHLPEILYEYRFDTGQNDPSSRQRQVTDIIFSRPVYQPLKNFPFIQDRQNYLKNVQKKSKT